MPVTRTWRKPFAAVCRKKANKLDLVERLRAAGCVWAEEEAELLQAAFSGEPLEQAVLSRVSGLPLAHVLGQTEFCGLILEIGAGVFVPRPRAEILAEVAVRYSPYRLLDLGCGCGALAAAVKQRLPQCEVHASDCDPQALHWARRNGAQFGFQVHQSDWLEAVPGSFDLIVAYLPHVPTAALAFLDDDHLRAEGRATVDGGNDGLDPLRAVLPDLRAAFLTLLNAEQIEPATALAVQFGYRLEICWQDEEDRVVRIYLPALRDSK